jgi:hypothetical protein
MNAVEIASAATTPTTPSTARASASCGTASTGGTRVYRHIPSWVPCAHFPTARAGRDPPVRFGDQPIAGLIDPHEMFFPAEPDRRRRPNVRRRRVPQQPLVAVKRLLIQLRESLSFGPSSPCGLMMEGLAKNIRTEVLPVGSAVSQV